MIYIKRGGRQMGRFYTGTVIRWAGGSFVQRHSAGCKCRRGRGFALVGGGPCGQVSLGSGGWPWEVGGGYSGGGRLGASGYSWW